ncbi:hypothetical protein EAO75_45190 [Streptomyces sp. uw30]|uniref:hypothetical protein n=1 Tax=Streptomyces sp. uw30 TaxID=1828179 RepID=UPI0011CE2C88|nr:hypothetical protein [Streptomyces sp. uw30]TXS35217.1 hypothetical protein EAO75_45190 [Streptomyces sp. uw30]
MLRGVTSVLHAHGYETAGFEAQISHVFHGAVYIDQVADRSFGVSAQQIVLPPTGEPAAGPRSPGPTTNPDDDSWRRS